jgi:MFS family permease
VSPPPRDGPAAALNQVLSEVIDAILDVRQAHRRVPETQALHAELGQLFADLRTWARLLADLDQALGVSPLASIPAFAAANATSFLMFASITSAAFLMAQYFQLGLGYSPTATGLRFLPWTLTPLLIAPAAGALADKIGSRPLMVTGLALQGGGLAWIALSATSAAGYGRFVLPLIIAGVGISMAIPTVPTTALNAVPPTDMGKASAVQNTLQRFGAVFGVALVAAVFSANGHLGSPATLISGFRPALAAAAAMSVPGALTALGAGARRRSPAASPQQAPALTAARR